MGGGLYRTVRAPPWREGGGPARLDILSNSASADIHVRWPPPPARTAQGALFFQLRSGARRTIFCRSGFSRDRRIPRSRLKPLLQRASNIASGGEPPAVKGARQRRGDRQGRSRGPRFCAAQPWGLLPPSGNGHAQPAQRDVPLQAPRGPRLPPGRELPPGRGPPPGRPPGRCWPPGRPALGPRLPGPPGPARLPAGRAAP